MQNEELNRMANCVATISTGLIDCGHWTPEVRVVGQLGTGAITKAAFMEENK